MRSTKIVTVFITNNRKILLLKRSNKVKSMKELWAAISGIIERIEEPIKRAKFEIFEEIGMQDDQIRLLKEAQKMIVSSPQYQNHEWEIYPFLFESKNSQIKLNWENSEFKWIDKEELKNFETVPSLEKVLLNLL